MNVAIDLPEDIGRQLEAAWQNVSQRTLEAVALEGYRSLAISHAQVGQLLGMSYWETEAFLKEKRAYLTYSEMDAANDAKQLDSLLGE